MVEINFATKIIDEKKLVTSFRLNSLNERVEMFMLNIEGTLFVTVSFGVFDLQIITFSQCFVMHFVFLLCSSQIVPARKHSDLKVVFNPYSSMTCDVWCSSFSLGFISLDNIVSQ